jgi:hypothetical protein
VIYESGVKGSGLRRSGGRLCAVLPVQPEVSAPDIWPEPERPDRPDYPDDERDYEERAAEFYGGGDDEQADRFP